MSKLLEFLHSPQLVAAFQRMCGIKINEQYFQKVCSEKSTEIEQVTGESNGLRRLKRKKSKDCGKYSNSELLHEDETSKEIKFEITNKFLYFLFCFGSSLGNEIFYISFFPFWFWNVDGYVGRRLCFFWGLFMYLGQATKDILKIPRPASPPVVRMEDRYALEYGMPSTHAMVGAGIPFGIYYLTKGRYLFPSEVTLIGAIMWCTLVCCSRCYLGMHSVLDVLAGLAYVFTLMFLCFYWSLMDLADQFVLHGGVLSFFLCLLLPLAMCIFYPSSKNKWSTARGDTTIIIAVCSGQLLSHWLSYHLGHMSSPTMTSQDQQLIQDNNSSSFSTNNSITSSNSFTPGVGIRPPYPINPFSVEWAFATLSRTLLGIVILVATRFLVKYVSLRVVCSLNRLRVDDLEAQKSLKVELPYKFATYSLLTICGLLICPLMFKELGIERETYFTEL